MFRPLALFCSLAALLACSQKTTTAADDASSGDATAALVVTVYTPADLAKGISPAVDD